MYEIWGFDKWFLCLGGSSSTQTGNVHLKYIQIFKSIVICIMVEINFVVNSITTLKQTLSPFLPESHSATIRLTNV